MATSPTSVPSTDHPASKQRSLDMAFSIDPDSLRGLEGILGEAKGSTEYKVKFSDGSTIKYSQAAEVLKQPNSDKRFIVSIVASAEGRTRSVFVTLRNEPAPSVEYTVTGPQRDVITFAEKLDDWVASCREWYSSGFSKFSPLVLLASIALPFFLANRVAKIFSVNTGIPGIVLIGTFVAEYLLSKLFPRGIFAIGYGAKRQSRLNTARNLGIFGFVVSFFAGLAVNWISVKWGH